MKNRLEILKEQNYTMLFLSDGSRLYPQQTPYAFLEILLGNEYHKDPEWFFLKGNHGKRMTEEQYLLNQVFIPYWSKDMLHELIVDIDEILNLSLDEADILVNKMVEGGICEKEDTYTRLNVIKGVAVQALKMK